MDIQIHSNLILKGIQKLIDSSRQRAAIFLNSESTLLYWRVGDYINQQLLTEGRAEYGAKIIATLSQQLTEMYSKGFTYTSLTRMCKVAKCFVAQKIATMSQQLSWSHLIELSAIDNEIKREFFTQLCMLERWNVRDLRGMANTMLFERTAIASKPEKTIKEALQTLAYDKTLTPELIFKNSYVLNFLNLPNDYSEKELESALINNLQKFIMELGNGFAFVERQKRIPVDSVDYYLDLLFYHRKLKRLIAVDLKLGKFKVKYKAQMELYLRWLQKNEMLEGEEKPLGLLLCSEGNTEHIELLMLDNDEIRVAQYLTQLPSKAWFAEKLQRSLEIAKMNAKDKE
jgi:predicted nuclease of restriction endonuclease-like (RecB) superfamily